MESAYTADIPRITPAWILERIKTATGGPIEGAVSGILIPSHFWQHHIGKVFMRSSNQKLRGELQVYGQKKGWVTGNFQQPGKVMTSLLEEQERDTVSAFLFP